MKQDLINGTNDEYYTHEYSIKPLLKYVKSGSTVWCPFDPPQSRFVTEFEKHGCTYSVTIFGLYATGFLCL